MSDSYYILADLGSEVFRFGMDATLTVSEKESGKISRHTIQDGSQLSDHYVRKNPIIKLTGVITDIKSMFSGFYSTEEDILEGSSVEYISEEGAIKYLAVSDNRNNLKKVLTDKISVDLFSAIGINYKDCFITELVFSQDTNHANNPISADGVTLYTHSYNVSMTLEQVRKGSRARLGTIPNPDFIRRADTSAFFLSQKEVAAIQLKEEARVKAIKEKVTAAEANRVEMDKAVFNFIANPQPFATF